MDAILGQPLAAAAAQGLPLFLPWSTEYMKLGSGFDSRHITSGQSPWISSPAFDIDDRISFIREDDGGTGSVREGRSSSTLQHSEHLSASLGATVGCSFLSANVTGSFDRAVSKNTAVRNSTCFSKM